MKKKNIYWELRNEKNLSLEKLSEEFKKINKPMDRQTIGRIENGKQQPSIDHILAYCKFFNVTSDYLLGLNNSRNNDISYQAISKFLGLSDGAIETLKDLKQAEELTDIRLFMNDVMSEPFIFNRLIFNMFLYVNSKNLEPVMKDDDGNFIPFTRNEMYYFLNDTNSIAGGYIKFNSDLYEELAKNQILKVIDDLKKEYNEEGE